MAPAGERSHHGAVLRGQEGRLPYPEHFLRNHFPPGLGNTELRVRVEDSLDHRGGWRAGLQHLVGSGGRQSSRWLGPGSGGWGGEGPADGCVCVCVWVSLLPLPGCVTPTCLSLTGYNSPRMIRTAGPRKLVLRQAQVSRPVFDHDSQMAVHIGPSAYTFPSPGAGCGWLCGLSWPLGCYSEKKEVLLVGSRVPRWCLQFLISIF